MKKVILIISILWIAFGASAQNDVLTFHQKSTSTSNTGMFVLGGWAIANLATGAYGWSKYSGDSKYFHQMNLFWNTVNLTIAGISLYSGFYNAPLLTDTNEIINKHLQTEKVLLINSALDVGYMGTGFLLRHLSSKSENRAHLLKGYGNSLILQGGFLFVFDLVLYAFMKSQSTGFLNNMQFSFAPNATGIVFSLSF